MIQKAVKVWLCEEDTKHLKTIGIPLEWTGGHISSKPPKWEYLILESIYQQLKIWSTSGTEFAGMTLENFLRTVNDTTTQDGKCTTINITTST